MRPTDMIGVVLTRPAGRAGSLAAKLVARGHAVVALPGSSIGPAPDAAAARQALRAARRADVVVFLSPAAVAGAFQLEPALSFAGRTRVLAPGPGTRAALRRRGIEAMCPGERFDSEGLLAMPVLAGVTGQRVALVGAAGGRELLAQTLRARGATVANVHVYARRPARLDRRHFERLAALPDALVSVWSSVDAIRHLAAGLPPSHVERLRRVPAVASSERIAVALRERGFRRIELAASARPADLLQAVAQIASRHRNATVAVRRRPRTGPTIR